MVTCIFNKLKQRWLWLNPGRNEARYEHPMSCTPWRPHTFVGKTPLPSFQLSYNACLVLKRTKKSIYFEGASNPS